MTGPGGASQGQGEITFRRRTTPLPDGRVRVQLEVSQGGRRLGTIIQTRGGWAFLEARVSRRKGAQAGGVLVWKTAEEAKRAVAASFDSQPTTDERPT